MWRCACRLSPGDGVYGAREGGFGVEVTVLVLSSCSLRAEC
jgi:hypothetical protein